MIKAIETRYKGYRFRSRLEARWAVFLDECGAKWEYEKEGYHLRSGCYLPDFWISTIGCWLEIKGQPPTEKEIRLCNELAYATESPVAIAWGLPENGWVGDQWGGRRLYLICDECHNSSGGETMFENCFWSINDNHDLEIVVVDCRWNETTFYHPTTAWVLLTIISLMLLSRHDLNAPPAKPQENERWPV